MNELVTLSFTLFALIIIIGSLSSYLFRKTGLPDMLFLIFLGLIFGPVLKLIKYEDIVGIAPYISVIALIIILFDGGISLNLRKIFLESPRAILLALLNFFMSVFVTAIFAKYVIGLSFVYGILLGSMIGGASSIIVISLVSRARISEKSSTILVLESTLTDVLCIIAVLTILNFIVNPQLNFETIMRDVANRFSTGIAVGFFAGVAWLAILTRIKKAPYSYMLTLAMIFLSYILSEGLGGSGALSCLLFGIVLGNESIFLKIFKSKHISAFDYALKKIETEIAFLIRTFFFVYIGLIAWIGNLSMIIYGLILSLLLFLVRGVAVNIATAKSSMGSERRVMRAMVARGIAAVVLSLLPGQMGLPNSEIYVSRTFAVILFTTIICTIGTYLAKPAKIFQKPKIGVEFDIIEPKYRS